MRHYLSTGRLRVHAEPIFFLSLPSSYILNKSNKLLEHFTHSDDLFLQQFGNKVGAGQFRGKALPTYVYPDCIKDVVRALIEENLRDYQDPEGAAVSVFSSVVTVNSNQ